MKNQIIAYSTLLVTVLAFTGPAFAVELRPTVKELRQEKKNIIEQAKDKIKALAGAMKTGTIQSINGNTLTITAKDAKIYTVNITSETKLLRRFGANSSLAELSTGDEVNVAGKFTDDTKITIDARVIRDRSIQKRHGVFMGTITAKNSDNFVIQSKERGSQTVYFGSAKIVNRKEETMTIDAVKVGDTVRVKGLWDNKSKKITEVEHIKDFSQPVKATVTPTVTQ